MKVIKLNQNKLINLPTKQLVIKLNTFIKLN